VSAKLAIKPVQILLVEDNPGDVRLTQAALSEGQVRNDLYVARDGVEAMQFLRRREEFRQAPRPDLVLLDLNLPRKSGREVLKEIKDDPELLRIPVIVLTSSEAEEDILRSYNLHANGYVTKPVDFAKFVQVMKIIEEFWFSTVKLPRS
jgi:two-component system, chemotaxis family, response regulator Rcp1